MKENFGDTIAWNRGLCLARTRTLRGPTVPVGVLIRLNITPSEQGGGF